MLPATTQDLQHGIDFTGLNTQTAAEHNQLVDVAAPYTDGTDDNQGIGFIISTTDTALNVPQVPNPLAGGYAKWKRYVWNRRSFGSTDVIGIFYQWNDSATSDATLLKWVKIDPNAYITIPSATSTVTGTSTDTLVNWLTQAIVNSSNALAATTANGTTLTKLANAIYGAVINIPVGATALATTVGNIQTAQAADEVLIGRISTQISGSATDPTLATGGINQTLATTNATVAADAAKAKLISNLTAGLIGQKIRVESVASVLTPVWYDPAGTNEVIVVTIPNFTTKSSSGALTMSPSAQIVPAGTWLIIAGWSGVQVTAAAYGTARVDISIGSGNTIVGTTAASLGGGNSPMSGFVLGTLVVTTPTGLTNNLAITNCTIASPGQFATIMLLRLTYHN